MDRWAWAWGSHAFQGDLVTYVEETAATSSSGQSFCSFFGLQPSSGAGLEWLPSAGTEGQVREAHVHVSWLQENTRLHGK